ncbi:hypothetical protein N8I77_006150 [Diaporthe amygdali]|uniref:Uncharacterized protein n=1 Tax=Phomopsis amygdali TaxID=1214568 RepID=A0AAD9SG02_PHOAM|nr:hypothetical protein N8I77_006150 [Diaporthe amygdali]
MRASRLKGQRAPNKKSQPLDPIDLSRRLNIVIAERQLEDLQLGKRPQDSDSDLPKARRTHDVRSQNTALPQGGKRSSHLAAPKTSTRWVFRTKPAADSSPHDSTDSSGTYIHVPRQPNAPSQRTATIRATRSQQCVRQNHGRPEQAGKYTMVLEECISEPERGRSGDAKERCPPDWTQVDSTEPKPRRLQLLKRMSPLSVLRLRLGGDSPPEADEVTKNGRARCDVALNGSSVGLNHRKSGVFSKLLH